MAGRVKEFTQKQPCSTPPSWEHHAPCQSSKPMNISHALDLGTHAGQGRPASSSMVITTDIAGLGALGYAVYQVAGEFYRFRAKSAKRKEQLGPFDKLHQVCGLLENVTRLACVQSGLHSPALTSHHTPGMEDMVACMLWVRVETEEDEDTFNTKLKRAAAGPSDMRITCWCAHSYNFHRWDTTNTCISSWCEGTAKLHQLTPETPVRKKKIILLRAGLLPSHHHIPRRLPGRICAIQFGWHPTLFCAATAAWNPRTGAPQAAAHSRPVWLRRTSERAVTCNGGVGAAECRCTHWAGGRPAARGSADGSAQACKGEEAPRCWKLWR
eukprot:scaffold159566_cov15-Tisochrysis_lutea.AAC.1